MSRVKIRNDYFYWMVNVVSEGRYSREHSYEELLFYLHNVEFVYTIVNDADRASDGIDLRRRFALRFPRDEYNYIIKCLDGPCSVLEMMIALAIRCEETIMDDPMVGDRTGQWFWKMIVNLGLGGMTDARFDERFVENAIVRFLNRDYEPDGLGGLFRVRDCEYDFRYVEIWNQMCYFLDTML